MDTFSTLLIAILALISVAHGGSRVVICYYDSWTCYRSGNGYMDISTMDPHLCTHLIYAYVGVNIDGTIRIMDPYNDLPGNGGRAGFKKVNDLRQQNKDLKTLISVGGWNEGSVAFSKVVRSEERRTNFVRNIVRFANEYGFNGIDIDWVYPTLRGGATRDKDNFVLLLKELAKYNILLTTAVSALSSISSRAYKIAEIAKYVTYINLKTYHFNADDIGAVTSFGAPLYPSNNPKSESIRNNVDTLVKYWISNGAPARKIVVGISLYGKGFTLKNVDKHNVGAKVIGLSAAGPYIREDGTMTYNELCEKMKKGGWHVVYDKEQRVPYAYKDDQWIGYEDAKSIKEKAHYIRHNRLGGAMVWSVDTDDFRGICGERFPLLKALNYVLTLSLREVSPAQHSR